MTHEFFKKYFPRLKCPYCKFEFSIFASAELGLNLGIPCRQCKSELITKVKTSMSGIKSYLLRSLRAVSAGAGESIVPFAIFNLYMGNSIYWLYLLIGVAIILLAISSELRSKELIIASYSH